MFVCDEIPPFVPKTPSSRWVAARYAVLLPFFIMNIEKVFLFVSYSSSLILCLLNVKYLCVSR